MAIAKRFLVSGRVQGVFFRAFTRDVALREGLTGTVRNLADGRVEAYVEGPDAAVAAFERELRVGPPAARVDEVAASSENPVGARDFRITG
ncbi:acylphosphatase [Stackebrandtia nassauensis]|uniref:acylphosphatase n=1 Tax=Stackebrandtia nassauensis (strain DSM 44728 / CIP 108903 / NRRL B-16338 / NBRC 102104 / LLR-40K-21) TaxID=446470 RepID=D3PW52_STANL|nr:acylphosphatase [Stackebrandtia nassauensis]ADD41209.1 acylphosphatase [Stackebrandtia nassauensis DSM 44728]